MRENRLVNTIYSISSDIYKRSLALKKQEKVKNIIGEPRISVEKTNSLIFPYIAKIIINEVVIGDYIRYPIELTLIFRFNKKRWEFNQIILVTETSTGNISTETYDGEMLLSPQYRFVRNPSRHNSMVIFAVGGFLQYNEVIEKFRL